MSKTKPTHRLSEREAAHEYRLRQAGKLLDLFAGANGRPAESIEELERWITSPAGRAATAYDRDGSGKISP